MKKSLLIHGSLIFLILLCAFSPFISAMVAGSVADRYNCELNEGSVHPCIVNGKDIGSSLYTFGVLGWFGLATIPVGFILVIAYLLVVVLIYLFRRNNKRISIS